MARHSISVLTKQSMALIPLPDPTENLARLQQLLDHANATIKQLRANPAPVATEIDSNSDDGGGAQVVEDHDMEDDGPDAALNYTNGSGTDGVDGEFFKCDIIVDEGIRGFLSQPSLTRQNDRIIPTRQETCLFVDDIRLATANVLFRVDEPGPGGKMLGYSYVKNLPRDREESFTALTSETQGGVSQFHQSDW
jgi:hypothetical protein